MHNTDYAYSVTSIRVKESSLLGQVEMDQLMAVSSYQAAISFLAEHGWEASSVRQPANGILRRELQRAWDELCEIAPDISILYPLILRKDYHNLKAGIKSKLSGQPVNAYFLTPSTLSHALLVDAITRREFSILPQPFASVGEEAYDVLVRTGDGQLADILIDRVALTDILMKAKATRNPLMIDLSELFCAAANIKIAIRAAQTDRNEEFLRRAISDCDTLDTESLISEAALGVGPLMSYLGTTPYAAGAAFISTSPSLFEKWCDDKQIAMLEKTKYEFFGPEPLIAYYLMKEAEIKNVRILLAAKENNIPAEEIRQRLRRLYA
jgi:V/A-type H+-transporting ATPase subunit C